MSVLSLEGYTRQTPAENVADDLHRDSKDNREIADPQLVRFHRLIGSLICR
jgi:hypothetical protein